MGRRAARKPDAMDKQKVNASLRMLQRVSCDTCKDRRIGSSLDYCRRAKNEGWSGRPIYYETPDRAAPDWCPRDFIAEGMSK